MECHPMSYDSGFGGGAGVSHGDPMCPGIRIQSPIGMRIPPKVPYIPLTLTTQVCAEPNVYGQSQGFTATQVAVGDPIVAFRNWKHIHWLTPVILELRTEVRGLQEFKGQTGLREASVCATLRRRNSPTPHFILDKAANPKLTKWGLGLTSRYPHIAEGSFAGKRSGQAHIGCSASLGACGWPALNHLPGAPPVLVVALCAPWSPWSSQTL